MRNAMISSRWFAAASVLAAMTLVPNAARAEFRRVELKIAGMD